MGESGRFDGEIDLPGGSFSRLLLSTDDAEHNHLFMYPSQSPPPLFSANTPKMLCFGDFASETTQRHPSSTAKLNLFNPPISHVSLSLSLSRHAFVGFGRFRYGWL